MKSVKAINHSKAINVTGHFQQSPSQLLKSPHLRVLFRNSTQLQESVDCSISHNRSFAEYGKFRTSNNIQ